MSLLCARNLSKTYPGPTPVHALRGVDFDLAAGEFVALRGASGSGKSTLLTLLSGLERPTGGTLRSHQDDLVQASEEKLADLRNRRFGFVFQSFHLVPSLTALDNVAFPAELAGDPTARQRGRDLLIRVGLGGRAHFLPEQLSGGEKQRVALCRAVVNRPALLFADEPTGNLDSEASAVVLSLLEELRAEHGSALLLVTHSDSVAERAERVVTVRDGLLLS